jgi:hypothetical protein
MPVQPTAAGSRLRVIANKLTANTRYIVSATNITNGSSAATSEHSRSGKVIKTLSLDARGVTKVELKNQQGIVEKSYVVVTATDIDCCIAKLVHDAINCTCKCDQCKKDLRRAQTVRLLLDSAMYEAHLGLADTANDKYNKAKALCTEVCACGC